MKYILIILMTLSGRCVAQTVGGGFPASTNPLTGGNTGQFLIKNSNTAYDWNWSTLASNLITIGALSNGNGFLKNNGSGVFTYENPSPGPVAWGSITGTLSNQTDLQTTINAKLSADGNGSALTGLTKTQIGLSNVDNTSDANKPVSTATQTALNLKQNTITVLPFANGGISGSAATSATTGTMTVNMTSSIITITPTGACTFNASGGVAGQIITFSITTSGVSSFVLTFGTNFRKTGTLATGTTSARFFTVTFRCLDGTIWTEIGRTAAQT